MGAKYFWLILSAGCLLWYMTVTVYVAVKGLADIKSMFDKLSRSAGDDESLEAEGRQE